MSISREVLSRYIKPGCQFIETGARWGLTAIKVADLGAADYVGCETSLKHRDIAMDLLQEALARSSMTFFVSSKDSIWFLHGVIPNKLHTVVFLDAHGEVSSPVLRELDEIEYWHPRPATILIDDLRCMEGWGIKEGDLLAKVKAMGYKVSFEDGVVPSDILVAQL